MGAFELSSRDSVKESTRDVSRVNESVEAATTGMTDTRRVKEECIIALKVYDSCRHPRRKILRQELITVSIRQYPSPPH